MSYRKIMRKNIVRVVGASLKEMQKLAVMEGIDPENANLLHLVEEYPDGYIKCEWLNGEGTHSALKMHSSNVDYIVKLWLKT